MKKWLSILVGISALAGGLYYWLIGIGPQLLSEKTLAFAEVRRTTIRDIVSATGLVEPRETVVVSSETAGSIVHISGRIGDVVVEGKELAQLDDRQIVLKIEEALNGIKLADAAVLQAQAAQAQAVANQKAAQRNLDIQNEIKAAGGLRHERELALAQLESAKAGVKAADAGIDVAHAKKQASQTARKEAELVRDMTRIRVPGLSFSSQGLLKREFLILDRKANEGQMVGPQGGPLFILAGSLDIVEVRAQVAEGDINKIKRELTAFFKIKNYNDEDSEFEGVVKKIRPLASNIKGAVYYDTVIEVKNKKDPKTDEWQLRPGMTASIDIVRYEHQNAWSVPVEALNFALENAYHTAAARTRIAEWKKRPDAKDWHILWVWDQTAQQPTPVFARIGARSGELALKDAEGNEILEWEPGRTPTQTLRVIIKAPPARAPGFLDQSPSVKL
ncbi:MAG: efflux RND transporter periplasmic adaptor subunit [Gemmataceae bacterium]|nr:efflux RND transporter periplasmic adaptor subunit [Gemmataceae bacterium]